MGNNIADPNSSPPTKPGEANLQPGIQATTILVTVIADIFVALRLLTRKFVVKSIGWDDWTIIGAALGITIGTALVLVEVHFGFGRHKDDISAEFYIEFTRYSYGEWIQTFQTLMFTKVSICLFLLRIVISDSFVYSLRAVMGVLIVSNVILTIIWIVQCRPLYLAWENPQQPGSCFDQLQLSQIILAQAIISILSDFVLACYPIFILRKIQMSLRVKVGLCILMGLGVITGSFCIVRTIGNWVNTDKDSTWVSVANWYWRSWEVCIGIVAACIPTLRPGYKSLRDRWRGSSWSNSSPKPGQTSAKTLQATDNLDHSMGHGHRTSSTEKSSFEGQKPLSVIPQLPPSALRPDLSAMRVHRGTAITHDDLHLPIQHNFGEGILKTTQVDLESRQTGSSNEL